MEFEGFRDSKGDDWDSNFGDVSSGEGEFGAPGVDAVVADLNAPSFSEQVRGPYGEAA